MNVSVKFSVCTALTMCSIIVYDVTICSLLYIYCLYFQVNGREEEAASYLESR
jgi:hypothetical protein